ncbi:MAG: single-stranded DNA-binding protein [Microbacterium sp.]|uniref:single-stranded DNA-binding protein n=1 Tax=Microbacterium sp. TaxID=51671 RepID=UPI0039E36A41
MSETITVVGTVGTIPEQRQVTPGVYVTGFRLASTHRRFDKEKGAWVDAGTSWYDVSVFRALGQHVFDSVHKGERVIVTGAFRLRSWETDSAKGVAAELTANAVGHDLLWGTSQFRKQDAGTPPRTSTESAETVVTGAETAAVGDAIQTDPLAGWGAPGTAREDELVETPF